MAASAIRNVEPPRQRDLDVHAVHIELRAVTVEHDVRRTQLRHAVDRIGHRRREFAGERTADRIVDVQHRHWCQIEEAALRGDVAREGTVKIEVVARDVGQHRGAKVHVVSAAEGERVR